MSIKEYFEKNDVFAQLCGAKITRSEPGNAVMELEIKPEHMSKVGRDHVHAGIIYTLAESASAAAVLAYGHDAVAAKGQISYFDAVPDGKIRAEAAAEDKHEDGTGICKVKIFDNKSNLIAMASFTVIYTGKPFTV